MRYLRKFCAATMLVCAFAFSTYADNIPCPGITASSQETVADNAQPQDNVIGKNTGAVPPAESNLANITDTLLLLLASLV